MAEITGKTKEVVTEELAGVIFQNPLTDRWETADEYLSGNVREKLSVARSYSETGTALLSVLQAPARSAPDLSRKANRGF